MHNTVTLWHNEHMRFARLLDFLEMQMAAFHAGKHPDYELMRDAVHYMQHFGNRYHHPREDEIFTRISDRVPDLQLVISRLLQEHRVIAVAGEQLLKYLEDILRDTMLERSMVEAAAATYLVYYRHHLNTEEKDLLPRAARLLRSEDWTAVATAVQAVPDPLFGDEIGLRYLRLHEQIHHAR